MRLAEFRCPSKGAEIAGPSRSVYAVEHGVNDDFHSILRSPDLTPIPTILHCPTDFLLTGCLIDLGGDRDIFQCDTERFE